MIDLQGDFLSQQPTSPHSFEGLYLVRRFTGTNPFLTASDLNDEQAQAMMRQDYRHVDDDNIIGRRRVEGWLREGAQSFGIERSRANPIYFAVIKDVEAYKETLRPDQNAVSFLLKDVDLSNWTFSMDDSLTVSAPDEVKGHHGLTDVANHTLHGHVLTVDDVAEHLASLNGTYGDEDKAGDRHEFEAHMWDKAPRMLLPERECPGVQFMKPYEFSR